MDALPGCGWLAGSRLCSFPPPPYHQSIAPVLDQKNPSIDMLLSWSCHILFYTRSLIAFMTQISNHLFSFLRCIAILCVCVCSRLHGNNVIGWCLSFNVNLSPISITEIYNFIVAFFVSVHTNDCSWLWEMALRNDFELQIWSILQHMKSRAFSPVVAFIFMKSDLFAPLKHIKLCYDCEWQNVM